MRFIIVFTIALLVALPAVLARTWTDTLGRTIEAEIVRADADSVTVLTQDREVRIPRSKLSEADKAYCDQWLEKLSSGEAIEDDAEKEEGRQSPVRAGELMFDGKPLITGGKVNVFEYAYDPETAEEAKKKYKSEDTGFKIGLAVPAGFDPGKPQKVFVANTAQNNAQQTLQGNVKMAGFFSKQCTDQGWVCFAYDSNLGRPGHDLDLVSACRKMNEVWPRFSQWEFVVGGFSGGGKACFYPCAYLLKHDYRVTGVFLANTNEDFSERTRKLYGVGKSKYKDIRVFLGFGKWDPVTTKGTAERMEKSLRSNGMKEVRIEYHDGKHSLYHPQFIEALKWLGQPG